MLTGPPPGDGLVAAVTGDDLRAEGRETMVLIGREWSVPAKLDVTWLPAFFVKLHCRLLHTQATGEITSKRAATTWEPQALDPHWHDLIARAVRLWRSEREELAAPADPYLVAETIAFMRYAREWNG